MNYDRVYNLRSRYVWHTQFTKKTNSIQWNPLLENTQSHLIMFRNLIFWNRGFHISRKLLGTPLATQLEAFSFGLVFKRFSTKRIKFTAREQNNERDSKS